MPSTPRGVALLSASRTTFPQLIVRLALAACAVLLATTVSTAQTTLYSEDFESYPDNYGWGNNGSNSGGFDGTETNWSLSGDDNGDYWYVNLISEDKKFEGKDLDGESVWTSLSIDVSGYTSLSLSIELSQYKYNKMDNDDYIRVFAIPDGGSEEQLFSQSNDLSGVTTETLSITATNTLQIRVKAQCDDDQERWRFDDLVLTGVSSCTEVAVTADAPTVSLDGNGAASVSADLSGSGAEVTVSSAGNCFTVSDYEISKTDANSGFASSVSFDCTETGVQNVWVRATDGTDVSTATATTVTIQDATAPVAVAQDLTVNLDANGAATITDSDIDNGSSDNCSVASLSLNITSFDCDDVGSPVTVTLTATDPSGNTDAATATVTVQDVTGPTIATPSGTYYFDSLGERLIWFGTTIGSTAGYSDACTADGDFIKQVSKTGDDWGTATNSVTYDCSEAGAQTIYVRGTDEAGNITTVSGTITLADNTAPTITGVSSTSVQLSTGAATVATSGLTFTTTENCAGEGITYTVSETFGGTFGASVDLDCADIGTTTLYFIATDAAGNASAEFSQDFTVTDATGLSAVGQNITVSLDANGNYDLLASDVDNGSVGNCNTSLSVSPSAFTCSDIGANEVTLTITDSSNGDTDATTVTVTVEDNTEPNVTAMPSVTVALGADGTASILPEDASTLGNPADYCTPNGSLTYQIKRENGTFGSAVTVDCTDLGVASFNVVVTAIDAEGNAYVSGNIPVTVNDTTDPVISGVSAGLTQGLSSAGTTTISASAYITASDNCTASGSLIYEISETSGSGFGTTFVADCDDISAKTFYFRVTDASGNVSAESSTSITIADNTAPTAMANAVTLFLSGGTVTLNATDGSFNTSTDACGVSTSEVKLTSADDNTYASSLTFTSEDDYDVTLRVTDASGNDATSTATVSVLFTVVNGCIDQTACNYDASANTDDGSCTFPGEECSSPTAGQGFVYTVNAAEDGCDCTAQDFEQVYFEDFGPGGAAGGQGGGYGFEGYTDFNENNIQDENTASAETEWTLSSDFADIGNGAIEGAEASYWATIRFTDNATPPNDIDTIFDGSWLDNEYQWTTRVIDASAHDFIRIQAELTEDGFLEPEDYIRIRLVEDGTESTSVLAQIVDDSTTPFPAFETVDVTQANTADDVQVRVEANNNANGEFHSFDDVVVSLWGKEGCTDSNASSGYDATAQVDDGSCVYAFVTAYSRYDGGFEDKLWAETSCEGDCGSAPYLDARQVDANGQTSSTQFNYVVSSGTTVTVNGTTNVDGDPMTKDLFVRDLTIKSGGALVIPAGKRLRVMGTFVDEDGSGVSGAGMLCIDGGFEVPTTGPDVVTVQDFELPPGSSVNVAEDKTLAIEGDLAFGDTDPLSVQGLVQLSGSMAQTITGDGATLDELQISNAAGVTVNDSLEVRGRLTLDASTTLAMGSNPLTFASRAVTGGGEKTALLDPLPSGASISGPPGRAMQSSNLGANVTVERYIAPDGDGVTLNGYTLFASPIEDVEVGDLDDLDGYFLAGFPGTDWPGSFATLLFWDEANAEFVEPSNMNTPLDTLGGAWIFLAGFQTPQLETSGTLGGHSLNSDSKDFSVSRSSSDNDVRGWNLVYNPFQSMLDWDAVIGDAGNAALVEDQYAIYDTQLQRFRRYGTDFDGVDWAAGEQEVDTVAGMQYIKPGQSFWVRVADGETSGTFTLEPEMIDNDGIGSFVRTVPEDAVEVVLETENAFGVTRSVLRFDDSGAADGYVQGDMSHLVSSSVKSGELAFVAGEQNYVAKHLPLEAFDGELMVRSRANMASVIRVVEVAGSPSICAHIMDNETGEVMVLQEGEELSFTLPEHEAAAGRFTLHSVPFGAVEGLSPDCPDSEAGMIVMELGEAVADLTVTDYATMEVVATLFQETGTVEIPMVPGEYAIMMDAQEGTTLCRSGRRQVLIAPGEQPELLGVEPIPSECNEGVASLAFELYGSGDYQTDLMQGNTSVWSETLPAGEHVLEGIAPGNYVLKVDHVCLETYEFVSLLDEESTEIDVQYSGFVLAEAHGGAWLEAACPICETGEGYGYTWLLEGEPVESDAPLAVRVEAVGTYALELVTYGFGCEARQAFDITVGKYLQSNAVDLEWMGVHDGQLGVRFPEEWAGVEYSWYDATGRLVDAGGISTAAGEVFIGAPDARGWMTLEVRAKDGRTARWAGIL